MYSLSCAEIGGKGCDFRAEGPSPEDVKNKIYAHAAEAHPERLQGMSDEDKQKMDAVMNQAMKAR